MTIQDQKEQFSYAYVRAVAAVARVSVTKPEVDDDSIDLNFRTKTSGGLRRSPQIDAQVKCTEIASFSGQHLGFELKIKNYHELRPADVLVPRILIVVLVADQLTDWLTHSESEMAMRRCGYWVSLRNMPDTTNTSTITVQVPRTNHFTVGALEAMMQRVRDGQLP